MHRAASAGPSDHVRHARDRKPSATAFLKSYNAIADSCLAESLQDIPGYPSASRPPLLPGPLLWKTHSVGEMCRPLHRPSEWQRVRDSNPCTGLERALIYLRKTLITSDL